MDNNENVVDGTQLESEVAVDTNANATNTKVELSPEQVTEMLAQIEKGRRLQLVMAAGSWRKRLSIPVTQNKPKINRYWHKGQLLNRAELNLISEEERSEERDRVGGPRPAKI